jgi:hypothetical protein
LYGLLIPISFILTGGGVIYILLETSLFFILLLFAIKLGVHLGSKLGAYVFKKMLDSTNNGKRW